VSERVAQRVDQGDVDFDIASFDHELGQLARAQR